VHLGLTGNDQLDLAAYPDFGQVEVDQAVLNLSTVETFFPEKRPFFLEGMEIFQVPGPTLFYSRRIGRGLPYPLVDFTRGESLEERPQAAEIRAAAKYTAKYSNGLSLGLLGANLERATATLRSPEGIPFQRTVYPSTNAGVFRVAQTIDERGSYLGVLGTYLRQAEPEGRMGKVGALDGVWKSVDRSTTVEFVHAISNAGPRTNLQEGTFTRVHLVRQWGKGWSVDGNAFTVSKHFDPNDLGYLDRPDRNGFTFDLDRRWDFKQGFLQNPMWRFTYCDFRDLVGKPYTQYVESFVRNEFFGSWAMYLGAGMMTPVYDDRELRTYGHPTKKYLRIPKAQWAFTTVETPASRAWSANLSWNHVWREGGPKNEVQLFQSIKPGSSLEVQMETSYTHSQGEWHYLETQGQPPEWGPDGTPIIGTRKLSLLNQVLRLSYAFSPRLTVQVFSQWQAANFNFRDLRSYVDDRTLAPGAIAEGPTAFSDRLWSLNLITRWEFRPGSNFFLVYTHGAWTDALINDRASLSPRRDLALMQHLPSDDVVQIKFSWMFQ
jgi:hypothetical protein